MSVGSLKTLMTMLAAAPSMTGVSLAFGEEMINAQDQSLPLVVVVPKSGTWFEPGYFVTASPDLENIWSTREEIDLYCWAFSSTTNAQPVDHADAVETLRANVLRALQYQRAQTDGTTISGGLFFKPMSGRWALMSDAVTRYGRAYILTVSVEIAVPDVSPVDATVTRETFTASFTA